MTDSTLTTPATALRPAGFRVTTAPVGLKDDGRDDFTLVVSEVPATCAAVFTRSRFAGPSVTISRAVAGRGLARGFVVIARNANVATGEGGRADAEEVRRLAADLAGVEAEELFVASTGVIGVRYPMDRLRERIPAAPAPSPDRDLAAAAAAIMTTDTRAKLATRRVGDATIVGIAKGVGMIEPDMATLLTFFCTDADLPAAELDRTFRTAMDRTFNALSIDTDTSTSDTAVVLANGLAGPVDTAAFATALEECALELVRAVARDGEGATTLIEVRVTGARDDAQAKRVGKAVVNSPLVKTAVHGADPNWGRVAMAIGKCHEETDIEPERVRIGFGAVDVYPAPPTAERLAEVAEHLRGDDVVIRVDLGIADGAFTVYGCDLTDGYIRINADYTT